MIMKKLLSLFSILCLIMILGACGNEGSASSAASESGQMRVFDYSTPLGEGSHHDLGAQKFKEELEKLSDGSLSVKIHYNNALGGEREVVEGMGVNTIDMGVASTGPIGAFVQEVFVFDLPYLFKDLNHAYAVLDGEIGKELGQKIEENANVKLLGWMENGYRSLTNSSLPIRTTADLKGIKHRTQESEVQVDTWKAFGANPTPMAWPEVYTALQQGVIDSQENPIPTIADVRFDEVQDYLSITEHVYSALPLMMSMQLWNSLSEEEQGWVQEAANIAVPYQRQVSKDLTEESINILEENGMEIIRDVDKASFIEATESVYEKWAPKIDSELIDKIKNYSY